MAEFFAILTTFGNAPRASAHIDVAADTRAAPAGTEILFTVHDLDGVQLAEFSARTNANGFASSSLAADPNKNLFQLTNNQPGLVRVRTPQDARVATAVLNQREQGTRLVFGVPAAFKSDGMPLSVGRLFPIALADFTAAALLIGNVSGADVNVDVYLGTQGGDGLGKYTNPRVKNNAQWRIDLQPSDENAHLVVAASGNVVVQLVLDDGRVHAAACLPV